MQYIRDVLDEAQMPAERLADFKAAVVGSMGGLARRGAQEAAALVLERFPEEHGGVVEALQGDPHLQYKYLQAATQVSWGGQGGWGGGGRGVGGRGRAALVGKVW